MSRPVAWVTLLVPEDRVSSLSLARWTGDHWKSFGDVVEGAGA